MCAQLAFSEASDCKELFEPMRDMAAEMAELNVEELAAEARDGDKSLEDFKSDMDRYNAEQSKFTKLPQFTFLGLIKLNSEKMRESVMRAYNIYTM